ncbi:MAG TPA: hypothetical protein VK013_13470 [Myxococcaceae bacterium]|nr:hypothetical protein [Myxococcaceae bacterium]
MRHPLLAKALLLAVLLLPAASLAQRTPQEFQAPPERTEAQQREEAARAKYNMGSYRQDVKQEVTPVPWMAIGLGGVALVIAALFAIPYYLRTAKMQQAAQEAAEIKPRRIR